MEKAVEERRSEKSDMALTVLTVVPENHLHGEESHQGMVLLFEQERGRPLALLDASSVTAIRTAAATGC